jgi:cation transport ATPase
MSEHRFAPTEPLVLVKAAALGFAIVQVIALGFRIGQQVSISLPNRTSWLLGAAAVTLITQLAYAYARRATDDALRILRSRRFDLAVLALFGAICAMCLLRTTLPLYELLFEHIDATASALLWSSALVVPAAYFIRSSTRLQFASEQAHFLDDKEISSSKEDALDIGERAIRFADQVSSADSSVTFGIDAPWGTGKTSFVNLCAVRWREASWAAPDSPDTSVCYTVAPCSSSNLIGLRYCSVE